MKKLWVNATPYDKKIVTTALESGADAVVLPEAKIRQGVLGTPNLFNDPYKWIDAND